MHLGECQRPLGEGVGLLQVASRHPGLPKGATVPRLQAAPLQDAGLHLREEPYRVVEAPTQHIRHAEVETYRWEEREVVFPTDAHRLFEERQRALQVALAETQPANGPQGTHERDGVIDGLGNTQSFFPEGAARSEPAQLGMAPGKPHTTGHRREEHLAEVLVALCPIKHGQRLTEAVEGLPVLALHLVDGAQVEVRQRVELAIMGRRDERHRMLGRGDGVGVGPEEGGMVGEIHRDLGQSARIGEGCGEGLGLAEIRQHTRMIAERTERCAQGEPHIDGLFTGLACRRQMGEGTERLLQRPHRLMVG